MMDSSKPYCGFNNIEELDADLRKVFAECITVPNHLLPEEFRDQVRGGRTLARLEELCDKRDGITEHVKKQAIKARNIERLRKQVEEKSLFSSHGDFIDIDGELDYSESEKDELQLHKNMTAMVGGMISGGIIEEMINENETDSPD